MLTVGDVYSYYIRDLNQYGACQILAIKENEIFYVIIDILKDTPINQNDLKDIRPLPSFGEGTYYQRTSLLDRIPDSYIYAGRTDPVLTKITPFFMRRWPYGMENILRKQWNEIPKEEAEAFKRHQHDRSPVNIGLKVYNRNHRCIDDEMLAEISDYSELDALPCLDSIHIHQHYEGLFTYLQQRHLITDLSIHNHNLSTLDLRESFFDDVCLDLSGIRNLYLNDRTRKLWLRGKAEPDIKICAKNNGAGISLMYSLENDIISNMGLSEITHLVVTDFHELDALRVVEQFPMLEELMIVGGPGKILNLSKISSITTLEDIRLVDVYGFTSEDLAPLLELKKLMRLLMSGVPEEPGKYARRAFKGKAYDLVIGQLRKPEWIIENENNPFRGWDGDEGIPLGAFKKASALNKDLKKDVLATLDKSGVLMAFKNYTEAFNKYDKRCKNFIETTQAEDIFRAAENVFEELLADKYIVTIDEVRQVIDENRNW